MPSQIISCWSCGHKQEFTPPLSRSDLCPQCRRDAKVCLNCQFFDAGSSNECSESQVEPVKDKEKSNFCDYFIAKSGSTGPGFDSRVNPLDKLFSSSSTEKVKTTIEDELELLFKKK